MLFARVSIKCLCDLLSKLAKFDSLLLRIRISLDLVPLDPTPFILLLISIHTLSKVRSWSCLLRRARQSFVRERTRQAERGSWICLGSAESRASRRDPHRLGDLDDRVGRIRQGAVVVDSSRRTVREEVRVWRRRSGPRSLSTSKVCQQACFDSRF